MKTAWRIVVVACVLSTLTGCDSSNQAKINSDTAKIGADLFKQQNAARQQMEAVSKQMGIAYIPSFGHEQGVVTWVNFAWADPNVDAPQSQQSNIVDLSPLRELVGLKSLAIANTKVSDLSPLKEMKLKELCIESTLVVDLSPLRGMPLRALRLDFQPERDAEILRSIKTLETINDKPATEFWREVEEQKKEKSP